MTKTLTLTVSVALLGGLFLSACGPGEEQAQAGPQTTCPMMGTPIDKKVFVDHDGKRIYLCCADCVKGFQADPDKQIKKMTDAGVILEDTPEDHSGHDH